MNRLLSVLARCATASALAIAGVASVPAAARAATYAQIEGTGSTWSEVIVQQWIADVDASGMKVVYTGGGSTKGRKDFAQDTNDFAISEIPFQGTDEQGNADTSNGRSFAYLPIVAGGTAFTYQLKVGNELVRNLRLSGETLTKIFTNQITNWNDPLTSYYPKKSGSRTVSQAGSDQVMNFISSTYGNGTIGYVEYSYPVNKNYPVVKVLNKGGYYVEPTQYNVAVALTKARINTSNPNDPSTYLTQILDDVYRNPDPRAYPISSYSYMVIPTASDDPRMTTAKRQTLADFMYYSLCAGQTKAGPYGYSPLPLNLVQAGFDQIAKLGKADKDVDLTNRDVRSCNNPTFDGKNLSNNKLAQIAPQPAACDKAGAGPCGTSTGTGDPSTDEGDGGTTDEGDGSGDGGGGGGTDVDTGGEVTTDAPGSVDPVTGEVVGGDTGAVSDGAAVYADPSTVLVADRAGDTRAFAWLSGLLLVTLVVLPGLYVSALRRRGPAGARS